MWNASELPSSAIRDRKLRQFICTDYFHDSFINEIELTEAGRSVALLIGCEREGARWATRRAPRYLYRLDFLDCTRVELETTSLPCIYLNGRFKIPTPFDRQPTTRRRRATHALRLQVLDDGSGATNIDIDFRRFDITRAVGEVDVPAARALVGRPPSSPTPGADRTLSELRRLASRGSIAERSLALTALALRNDRRSLPIAEAALRSTDEFLLATAVHAVGLVGARKQVPMLATVLRNATCRFSRRQIVEAMVRASSR